MLKNCSDLKLDYDTVTSKFIYVSVVFFIVNAMSFSFLSGISLKQKNVDQLTNFKFTETESCHITFR